MCNDHTSRRGGRLHAILGAALAAACITASAETPSLSRNVPAAAVSETVQELLEVDAQRALAAERLRNRTTSGGVNGVPTLSAQNGGSSPPSDVSATSPPSLRLLGIFGVGSQLRALVSLRGDRLLVASGRPLPLSLKEAGYQEARVDGTCVHLTQQADLPTRICMHREKQ